MRHHQNADVRPAQIVLQPFGHLQIQMVGWLIENNQLRFQNQDISQGDPLQLAPRQLTDLLVEPVDIEFSQDLFRPLLVIPRFQGIHPLQDPFQAGMILTRDRRLIFSDRTHGLILREETGLQDRQVLRIGGRLLQVANPQVFPEDNLSAVIALLTGYDVQKRRFSRSVLGDQADLLPLRHTKRYILEKNQVAKALGQFIYLKVTDHYALFFFSRECNNYSGIRDKGHGITHPRKKRMRLCQNMERAPLSPERQGVKKRLRRKKQRPTPSA